jgi:hypothetical protein
VGNVGIVKTGATVAESYFKQDDGELDADEENIIWIRPWTILLGILALAAVVALIFFGRKFYDNFYLLRHQMEMRRIDRSRFKEKKQKKKYRKRDRMFK